MEIPRKNLSKYITSWMWKKLQVGGRGEIVEDVLMEYILNDMKCTNIKRTSRVESCDFYFKKNKDKRVDIRRIGKDGTMYLGYTSMSMQSESWTDKARSLKSGGYLAVEFEDGGIKVFYVPAKWMLEKWDIFTKKVKVKNIYDWCGMEFKYKNWD